VSLPYYKRFPRDFLDGTIGLCLETKGAYAIVLDLIYMRDGRLADDARYIAGQLGCSVRKWTAIRKELVEKGKIQCLDGIISNFRADYLTEESRKYQDNQREIAGLPRKNNALRQPKPSQSESEAELKKEKTTSSPKKGARLADDWLPSKDDLSFAAERGFTVQETNDAAIEFRNYWLAEAGQRARKLNWSLTFRNRIIELAKRRSSQAGKPSAGGHRQKPASMVDILLGDRAAAANQPDVSGDGWLPTDSDGVFVRGSDTGQPF
jgi:uncharacterized protein YdaU (DUF1376 family)